MFASSKVFEKVYILELSYWTEGMPLEQYQKFLKKYGFPPLSQVVEKPEVIKTVERDIPVLGELGLQIIPDIGMRKHMVFQGCIGCEECVQECPEDALEVDQAGDEFRVSINLALCDGVACRRCERKCGEKVFDLISLLVSEE